MKRSPAIKRSGFAHLLIIFIILIVVIIVILVLTKTIKFSATVKVAPSKPTQSQTSPTPTPTPLLTQTYTHPSAGFTIMYPGSWAIDTAQKSLILYTTDGGATSAFTSPAGIIISASPLSEEMKVTQLSTIADIFKVSELKSQFADTVLLKDGPAQIGAYQTHVFEITYTDSGKSFRANLYLVKEGSYLYVLLATSIESSFPTYESTFKTIVNSFKLTL